MKKTVFVVVAVAGIVVTRCKDSPKRNMQPEIAACDSAAVMYYHTPGNPRFFNMAKVYDKDAILSFSKDVNNKIIKSKDTCTTQGKIYFYGQKGVVYVVYFSRLDDCMTLSFIKTGEKYFTKMSKTAKELLDRLQKKAGEPIPQSQ